MGTNAPHIPFRPRRLVTINIRFPSGGVLETGLAIVGRGRYQVFDVVMPEAIPFTDPVAAYRCLRFLQLAWGRGAPFNYATREHCLTLAKMQPRQLYARPRSEAHFFRSEMIWMAQWLTPEELREILTLGLEQLPAAIRETVQDT